MKKGLLQRASKNWEIKLAQLPIDIKQEPLLDRKSSRPSSPHLQESLKVIRIEESEFIQNSSLSIPPVTAAVTTTTTLLPTSPIQSSKRVQSMIAVRKDYSYKYTQNKEKNSSSSDRLDISGSATQQPNTVKKSSNQVKKEVVRKNPLKSSDTQHKSNNKPNISILERHDYNKDAPKISKISSSDDEKLKKSAIEEEIKKSETKVMVENLNTNILKVPIGAMMKRAEMLARESEGEPPAKKPKKKKKKKKEKDEDLNETTDQVKVIVAQKVESTPTNATIKQEPSGTDTSSRQSTESKDSQNINKINNKINIIFQLNDNSKSLRKNIILHRRAPKKMTKITIKESNNNINSNSTKAQPHESDLSVPDKNKILCTIETQTEDSREVKSLLNMSSTIIEDITEHLYFESDILICVGQKFISFYDYYRLSALLKKGESDFRLIDKVTRRFQDVCVDNDNKFQRLCYNEDNPLPIYVEMRAKQKELEDPESCPIAFVYCNVYYIDQRYAKFSSVHLDTVKSVTSDICYTTIPKSCYFIMAWSEKSLDLKNYVTGLVKYKLTPNLDLAKLASIRQFPKVFYRIKQMYCGKDSQLITNGDSQVSIFNYNNGDLLISLDLMKNYGVNLTTFGFEENYLFMVYLTNADDVMPSHRRIIVIGVNKYDGNTLKVIQSTTVKIGRHEKILSRSITSTNHLIATFTSGTALMLYLDNFKDIHLENTSSESIVVASNDFIVGTANSNLGLAHFTEFFLH